MHKIKRITLFSKPTNGQSVCGLKPCYTDAAHYVAKNYQTVDKTCPIAEFIDLPPKKVNVQYEDSVLNRAYFTSCTFPSQYIKNRLFVCGQ